MLFMPYVVLFYEENGLGMKEVMLLQAIYSITIVALEIPSGYLADVLGRKKSIVYGSCLAFLGFFTYSLSFGFTGFLVAEIALGIGQSLVSGADSALLYDTLLDMKKEKQYIKYEGRITSLGNISEAVAAVLASFLAVISLRAPYIAQTFIALIAIPASVLLVEPARHKRMLEMRFRDVINIVRYALYENKDLQRNILFSSVIGTSTLTMAWFVQPFFQHIDLPKEWFGPLWAALNLTVGMVALIAYRIEHKIGAIKSVLIIAILVPGGYLILGNMNTYFALPFLFLFYIIRGFATPVLKDYINRMSSSDIRATVLSVRNFIIRLYFALIAPFLGWYTDKFSITEALIVAGIIFGALSGVTFLLFLQSLRIKKRLP